MIKLKRPQMPDGKDIDDLIFGEDEDMESGK